MRQQVRPFGKRKSLVRNPAERWRAMTDDTDDLIRQYCKTFFITREQYEAESILQQEQIDALVVLRDSSDDDPVIPLGLPGAGKRRSELTDAETEHLSACECELDDLLQEKVSA